MINSLIQRVHEVMEKAAVHPYDNNRYEHIDDRHECPWLMC